MSDIIGKLALTFEVRDAADVEKIMAFYREWEGVPVMRQPKHAHRAATGHRITKQESQDRIIALLKESFHEGFTMADATAKVFEKLKLRETTTKHTITRAKKDGILLRRGHVYVWTEVVTQRVVPKLQERLQPQQQEQIQQITPSAQ